MTNNRLRFILVGAQEVDLPVLSALHNRQDVEIVAVYDRDRRAVGTEIAEILGIPRAHTPDQLADLQGIDCAVISEPREKFTAELEVLARSGARILNPSEALQQFQPGEKPKPVREESAERRTERSVCST